MDESHAKDRGNNTRSFPMRSFLVCAVLIATTASSAADVRLKGNVGSRIIYEDVIIARGTTCVLNDTTIYGNIRVLSRAKLFANGVQVIGNVEAYRALVVDMRDSSRVTGDVQGKRTRTLRVRDGSWVGGDVQLTEGSATQGVDALFVRNAVVIGDVQAEKSNGRLRVRDTIIGGNLQFVENRLGRFVLRDNEVVDDLQFFKNMGNGSIIGNRVGRNLQSKENTPLPTVEENDVGGNTELE